MRAGRWLPVVALLASCTYAVPDLPGADEVTFAEVTDAEVGKTGRLRISVADPVAKDTDVTLVSNQPTIAQLPTKATIKKGGLHADVSYMGLAAGTATFSATVGTSTRNTTIRVYPSLQVTSLSTPGVIQTGAAGTVTINLNMRAATDVTVTLSSSNAAVVEVPTTVVVPAFASSYSLSVKAKAAGTAVFTATYLGNSVGGNLAVVDDLVLTGVSVGTSRVQIGATTLFTMQVNATAAADTTFTLTSSNPAVATIPTSVTMPGGFASISVPVATLSAGATVFTAQMGAYMRSVAFVVVADVTLTGFTLSTGNRAVVGAPTAMTLSVDALPATPRTVTVTSSAPTTLSVPATVTFPPGVTSVAIPVDVLAPGSVTLTATAGNTRTIVVNVVATQTLMSVTLSSGLRLVLGASTDLNLTVDVASGSEFPVSLTSSDPEVLAVPATLTVPPGGTSTSFQVQATKVGTTLLTATANGVTRSILVTVAADALLSAFSLSNKLVVGTVVDFSLSLDSTPAAEKIVTLTSSNPSVLTVPATISMPTAFANGLAQAKGVGTATVTATLAGVSRTVNVTVVAAPSWTGLSASTPVQTGATGSVNVSFDSAMPVDTIATLQVSEPGIITVPSSLLIQRGSTVASAPFTANATGSVLVTATVDGVSRSTIVTVVGTTYLSTFFVQFGGSRMQVGAAGQLYVALSATAATDATITLSNSNPTAFTTPASVVIPAGSSAAQIGFEALAPGVTTIAATYNGTTRFLIVEVVAEITLSLSVTTSVIAGRYYDLTVVSDAIPAADVVVTINNTAPSVFSTPAQLVIPAGTNVVYAAAKALIANMTADLSLSYAGKNSGVTTVTVAP